MLTTYFRGFKSTNLSKTCNSSCILSVCTPYILRSARIVSTIFCPRSFRAETRVTSHVMANTPRMHYSTASWVPHRQTPRCLRSRRESTMKPEAQAAAPISMLLPSKIYSQNSASVEVRAHPFQHFLTSQIHGSGHIC